MNLPKMGPYDAGLHGTPDYHGLKDGDSPNRFPLEAVIIRKPNFAVT